MFGSRAGCTGLGRPGNRLPQPVGGGLHPFGPHGGLESCAQRRDLCASSLQCLDLRAGGGDRPPGLIGGLGGGMGFGRLPGRGLRLRDVLRPRGEFSGRLCEQCRQFRVVPRPGQPQTLLALQLEMLHLPSDVFRPVGQRRFQLSEPLGAKQLPQNLLPLVGPRGQQLAEPALRQHHYLAELFAREAEKFPDARLGVPDLRCKRDAFFRRGASRSFPEDHLGRLGDHRRTPNSLEFLGRTASHPITAFAQQEVEHHLGGDIGRGRLAAHLIGPALAAARLAVEGEDHRIEDAGLA